MVAYEFYFDEGREEDTLIGILPERRKDSKRATRKSIMNWAKKIFESKEIIKNVYFLEVEI